MQPSIPVVVATKNLTVGAVISSGDVTVKQYPTAVAPNTAASKKEQVVGKTIAFGPVLTGEAVRSEHIADAGSLLTILRTFAPEGWSAVELPPDAATGMSGLLRDGDSVILYGETAFADGSKVDMVTRAIILRVPDGDKEGKQYVVAVPDNYAPAIAEILVRGKKITIVLPSTLTERQEVASVEVPLSD